MKYALVTGADHGVGLELVKNLLKREYFVVACRLNSEEKQVDGLLQEYPDMLRILELNIGEDESVAAMAEKVKEAVPCIDLLINDAGILGNMSKVLGDDLDFEEITREALQIVTGWAGLDIVCQRRQTTCSQHWYITT